MDFLNKNKTTIGGLVLLALCAYVYFMYFGGEQSAPLTATPIDSALSGNLLITLNSLGVIKLDDSIFTDSVFASLSDFGTTIPQQDAGRGNPFAPLGKKAATATSSKP